MPATELHYRLSWRTRSLYPGAHQGVQRGAGFELHGLTPLLSGGDPRRLDLRASARDPFGRLLVRTYLQRSAVRIYVIGDLSASMAFTGAGRKLDVLSDFVAALGHSAYRAGDPVVFFGCDRVVRDDCSAILRGSAAAGEALAERLRALAPTADGAEGVADAASRVPAMRSLVFIVSDFYWPTGLLDDTLAALARHEVVPVALRDSVELRLPGFGLLRVRDSETGLERSVLARPGMQRLLEERARAHDDDLERRFAAAGVRAIWLSDRFDAAAVTRHFYG
jgi:uncharacterized protein (DUF58 family)